MRARLNIRLALCMAAIVMGCAMIGAMMGIFAYSHYYMPSIEPQWLTRMTRLMVDGDADLVTLVVQGHTTQTNDVLQVQQSDTDVVFSVDNDGNMLISGTTAISGGAALAGDLDMGNYVIENIGAAGTDFQDDGGLITASTVTVTAGGLVVSAGTADLDGGLTVGDTAFTVAGSTGDTVISGTLAMSSTLSLRNQNELRFYDNGNYVGFKPPALAADQIWTLPAVDGSDGQYLQTNGAGALAWQTPAGAGDMLQSTYDVDSNDFVDMAEGLRSSDAITLAIASIDDGKFLVRSGATITGVTPYVWRTAVFCVPGTVTVGTNKAPSILFDAAATIDKVYIYARTAPTATSLIVDVNKNGVTIFTNQANRPEIAAGANEDESGIPDVVALAKNDRLDVDIDQIGSSVAGADLTIMVRCKQDVLAP